MASVIQYFVRERRHIRHHTVEKYIIYFLEGMGFTKIDRDCQRDVNTAPMLVQLFLNHLGYQFGQKKGMIIYRLREENARLRDEYINFMTAV